MTTKNIERFNEIVGEIFGRLYESFPVKIDIKAIDIVRQNELAFFLDTVDWLKNSGYLIGVRSSGGIHNAVLTAKGLEVLNATPGSLEKPLGVRISDSIKIEGKEALRSLVSQTLGIGLQYMSRGLM
ncbi:TPA: hypothetical protein G8O65_003923 [Salmonella enterica]|uniref:DUF2513 domain-containing protein n=1 Tax=Salmonella enterica TaxID=28901 RepID=A0A761KY52_SALER|nr:hypothetical protein [Salmonella enterica]HDJ1975288.1 hypothetical protein [Salmonella enterica subsp. enterica]HAG5568692.1 hypothetical protein [Salmonella enterica]HAK0561758.1 hypothetical protein [Salmonella enterica]HAK0611599.1 hypothetical protein [Salmonella enterica]